MRHESIGIGLLCVASALIGGGLYAITAAGDKPSALCLMARRYNASEEGHDGKVVQRVATERLVYDVELTSSGQKIEKSAFPCPAPPDSTIIVILDSLPRGHLPGHGN